VIRTGITFDDVLLVPKVSLFVSFVPINMHIMKKYYLVLRGSVSKGSIIEEQVDQEHLVE
jgi:hypothetical protein